MNVGICIRHEGEHLSEAFRRAAAQGFHHCQFVSWEPELWTDEEAARVNALCAEYAMTITAFWCGWSGPKHWNFIDGPDSLGLVPVTYRAERIHDLLNGAAFAKKLHVSDVVTHMGFMPENPTDPKYEDLKVAIRYIAKTLLANGQNLLFETGQETPVTLLRLFEDVGTGNLYINLDPANLILYGKANPVDALDVFGDYVRGVHAKDGRYPTNGRELGEEVKVGAGKVNFPALLKGLKEHGFDGSLTIEREIEGEQQLLDIKDTQKYLSDIIAKL